MLDPEVLGLVAHYVRAALVGLAILAGFLSVIRVLRDGVRDAFTMDPETLRLVGILMFVGAFALTTFSGWFRWW